MRKNNVAALLLLSAVTLGMVSCKKESLKNNLPGKTTKNTDEPNRRPVYSEGIQSYDFYDAGSSAASIGYWCFWGPSTGQRPPGSHGLSSPPTANVFGFGATAANYVIAYQNPGSPQVQFLDSWLYGQKLITLNGGANYLTSPIEEIEIRPGTNEVYAVVRAGISSMRIYSIDMTTGDATPLNVNGTGGNVVFNSPLMNGYKSGSIAFVPDGSGGYELVYSTESTVYASLGLVSWHFSISGTAINSVVANHENYTGIPGTGNINTTYGNGKLYFARNGSSNAVYSLPLTPGTTGASTATSEGFSVTNTNDFGYWRAF